MKRIYITLSMALLFATIHGQNKSTAKADKYFETYQYANAIKEYSRLAESKDADKYVYKQLADSYYVIDDMENASLWYAKAVAGKNTTGAPETYYRYAQALKAKGKYDKANEQMQKFAELVPEDVRAKDFRANPNYATDLLGKSKLYNVSDVEIGNRGGSDFGAFLTNDNVFYFVSTRGTGKTDKWNNQTYLDVFSCKRNSNGTFTDPSSVSELNSPYHDGPVTISEDGKTMYFARDSHVEKQYKTTQDKKIRVGQQGLYKATKVDGQWSQIEALPFNSINYSVSNPSLSKDGKTLYFASNMPGGQGDTDVWKVSIDGKNYGKPQNLGTAVNTPEKESFPFIDADNVLYFASSGKPGLGGMDIFKMDASGKVENLGAPVNSERDDFSFAYNKTFDVAYFSSNRKGNDVIYSATPICEAQALLAVTNTKTGKPLANASVTLMDGKGKTVGTKTTGADGKVSFDIDCQTEYSVRAIAENFDPATAIVSPVKSGATTVQVGIKPFEVIITEKEVILSPIYFEFNKSDITEQGAEELDKLVKVMQEHPTFVIFVKSHTDSKGSAKYNLDLSEKRAQSTVQYVISKGIAKDRISGKGFGSLEPKVKCGEDCTEEEDAQNRRSEFLIVKK